MDEKDLVVANITKCAKMRLLRQKKDLYIDLKSKICSFRYSGVYWLF